MLNELYNMTEAALAEYFLDHAVFDAAAPKDSRYRILVGNRFVRSDNTSDLWDKFIAALDERKAA